MRFPLPLTKDQTPSPPLISRGGGKNERTVKAFKPSPPISQEKPQNVEHRGTTYTQDESGGGGSQEELEKRWEAVGGGGADGEGSRGDEADGVWGTEREGAIGGMGGSGSANEME